jgi:hypothetical protein
LSAATVEAASALAGVVAAVAAGVGSGGGGGSVANAMDPTPMHKEVNNTFARTI